MILMYLSHPVKRPLRHRQTARNVQEAVSHSREPLKVKMRKSTEWRVAAPSGESWST